MGADDRSRQASSPSPPSSATGTGTPKPKLIPATARITAPRKPARRQALRDRRQVAAWEQAAHKSTAVKPPQA
jgi:hypothetical protein